MTQTAFRVISRVATLSGTVLACLSLALSASTAASAAEDYKPVRLTSLRGVEIEAPSPAGVSARNEPDGAPLPRDFVQQPPLIPHSTETYIVSKEFNKCMDCHAWSRAREMRATKISITHFKSREGAEMSSVSPNRYFCNQCHVSQTNAKPLVGNDFKPGTGLR